MEEVNKLLDQIGLLNECKQLWNSWKRKNNEHRFMITMQVKCYCEVISDERKKLKSNRVLGKEYIQQRIEKLDIIENMLLNLCKDSDLRNPDIE